MAASITNGQILAILQQEDKGEAIQTSKDLSNLRGLISQMERATSTIVDATLARLQRTSCYYKYTVDGDNKLVSLFVTHPHCIEML